MSSMSRERKPPTKSKVGRIKLTTDRKRGRGGAERSKSGGSVRGTIPKAGGSNSTDFESGMSLTVERKKLVSKVKHKTKINKSGNRENIS